MNTFHLLVLSVAVIQYCVLCKCDILKDFKCDFNQGPEPNYTTDNIIHYDKYTPSHEAYLYNCSSECSLVTFTSINELSSPDLFLKSCFNSTNGGDAYECETRRFNNLKNIDKLWFLNKMIPNKRFYLVNCTPNLDSKRKCYKKDEGANLVPNAGNQVNSNRNRTTFEEFICEEDMLRIGKGDIPPTLAIPKTTDLGFKEVVKLQMNIKAETNITIGRKEARKVVMNFPDHIEVKRLNCTNTGCIYKNRFKVESVMKNV